MNTQINITENGTTTLATAGKYCDRNIDVNVEVASTDNHYDEFWNECQNNGKRTIYQYAFAGNGWSDKNFKPKYDIKCSSATYIFGVSKITNLKNILESCGVVLDMSNCTDISSAFAMSAVTTVPKLDISSATSTPSAFNYCWNLETIEEMVVSEKTVFSASTFKDCYALKNLTMSGTMASNGLDLHWSTKLTHDSLMSIINCLADKTGDTSTVWKVTFGSENLSKLTAEEIKIANDKGWVIE